MIITTNDLNNIETKITTPQIEGIEFIDAVLSTNDDLISINASYNDIMTIIENGKLPIIICNGNNSKYFMFISSISFKDPYYKVLLINGPTLETGDATTNMGPLK